MLLARLVLSSGMSHAVRLTSGKSVGRSAAAVLARFTRRSIPTTSFPAASVAATQPAVSQHQQSSCLRRIASSSSIVSMAATTMIQVNSRRTFATYGRITDEDRRWWLIHLECCPDVTPGTFVSWLDSCGTHTCKKLIERDVWTIEQVAAMSSDQVDELRYKEGCIHMDVVWEHARTVLQPLKGRVSGSTTTVEMNKRIAEIRKKRQLEQEKAAILKDRQDIVDDRAKLLNELKAQVAKRKEALRQKQREAAAAAAAGGEGDMMHQGEDGNDGTVAEQVRQIAEEERRSPPPENPR